MKICCKIAAGAELSHECLNKKSQYGSKVSMINLRILYVLPQVYISFYYGTVQTWKNYKLSLEALMSVLLYTFKFRWNDKDPGSTKVTRVWKTQCCIPIIRKIQEYALQSCIWEMLNGGDLPRSSYCEKILDSYGTVPLFRCGPVYVIFFPVYNECWDMELLFDDKK